MWKLLEGVWNRVHSKQNASALQQIDNIPSVDNLQATQKQKPLFSLAEMEIELLTKEYDALRAEMIARLGSQTQVTTIATLLLGGIVTLMPLLLSRANLQVLGVFQPYLVTGLLTVSLLFTSLLWSFMDNDVQIAEIGEYLDTQLRMRVFELLNVKDETLRVMNWGRYRLRTRFRRHSKDNPLLLNTAVFMLNTSRYGLNTIPAILTLISVFFLIHYQIPAAGDIIGWFNLGFLVFDSFYLITAIGYALYFRRTYRKRAAKRIVPDILRP
jgi:hypothetical protein